MNGNGKANKWHPWKGHSISDVPTRQTRRATLRRAAFADISKQYSGETRKQRKILAKARAQNQWYRMIAG